MQRTPEMSRSETASSATAPPFRFQAVHRGRIYAGVVRQIEDLVTSGKLKPGDRLPPERELVKQLQVSRSSLRDALRTLELMGLVRSRQGRGTVVCEASAESLVAPISSILLRKRELVAELLDVRKIIEPPLAARAALHATSEQIAHLEEVLRQQQQKMRRNEPAVAEDSEFHYTLALAAKNSVVRKFLDLLMTLLRDSRAQGLQVPGRLSRSLAGHRRILRAVRRREPRAAELAMRRHLRDIEDVVLESIDRAR